MADGSGVISAAVEPAVTVEMLHEQIALRIAAEERLAVVVADVVDRSHALRAAEELARMGSWTWMVGSQTLIWSDQVHQIFGTDPDGPVPTFDAAMEMIHPDDREMAVGKIREALATGGSYQTDHRIVRPNGEVRRIHGAGRAELDAAGVPRRFVGSLQDVSDMLDAEQELQRSRDLFAGVLDAATEQSIIATDAQGLITVFNRGAERMLGYRAREMLGRTPELLHDPEEIRRRADELGIAPGFDVFLATAARGEAETRQWTYVTRSGQRLQALITVSAMRAPDGVVTGYIKVGTDVTETRRAESALRNSERRFRTTFQAAPNGMMLIDLSSTPPGRFLQVNAALSRLTGYSAGSLLTMNVQDLTSADQREVDSRPLDALKYDGEGIALERHWIHAEGHDLWVQFNVGPPASADDTYVVGQVDDITARKRADVKLTHQALHDELTGLPNRLLLMDRIDHALAASARSKRTVGLLYLDLDGFKAVNDSGGHAAGDRVLVEVANRLRSTLRPGDTVARLGGDEFVVVCDGLDDSQSAKAIADRVLSVLREPYLDNGASYSLSASIGISLSDSDTEANQFLMDADQAMYGAKSAGKGRVRVGGRRDSELARRSAGFARAARIEAELARALKDDSLIFFGQPVVDLRSRRAVAVETLIRWRHPDLGLLSPHDFLDVAEGSDLMLPIGSRALAESCRLAALWVDQLGSAAPAVHVNVSGRQLEAGDLAREVDAALNRYRVAASQLVLELTETHMPLLADSMRNDLSALRERGVKIAIDDLGTGYSSLTRITELPVDILKIDLSFVGRMAEDPASAAVVRGILAIGSALDLAVVAEGVETSGQESQLVEYGCDLVQGYLYSRPRPEIDLLAYLLGRRPTDAAGSGRSRSADTARTAANGSRGGDLLPESRSEAVPRTVTTGP